MKSMLRVTHKDQLVTFRSSVFHLSSASVLFFLKAKYRSIDVAALYDFLAHSLMTSRKFTSISINFTLVNVYSGDNGFSHGVDRPPPEELRPANNHLIFTFAYDVYDHVSDLKITVKNKLSNSVSQYGNRHAPTAFTSVGLTSAQCAAMGLNALYTEHLAYLYNVIGVMTKSLAKNRRFYSDNTYASFYGPELKAAHDKYGMAPLYKIFLSTPYPFWVYSPAIWKYAPNLLSKKMLNPQTVLYYFMYIYGTSRTFVAHDRLDTLLGIRDAAEGSVLGYLSDSILQFVQNANTEDYEPESPLDVLAPSVIMNVIINGLPKIDPPGSSDSQVWASLRDTAATVERAFSGVDLGNLFLPPDQTALKLFSANDAYMNRLTTQFDLILQN